MGKPTTYLNDEDDGDIFHAEDFDSDRAEPEARKREHKTPQRHAAARQRLDSRNEDLWLKQQLKDWDDDFDAAT